VRDGKGSNSRMTMLPLSLCNPLKNPLHLTQLQHQQDLVKGYGSVYLPRALERKYPHADRQWVWQYIFPIERVSKDPRSGIICCKKIDRHHPSKAFIP
jgi:hypothetical protein